MSNVPWYITDICQMNIQIAFYSIITLLFSLFGSGNENHIATVLYENSQELTDNNVENQFNKMLESYYSFYNYETRNLVVKMGEKSHIKQVINKNCEKDLVEIAYEESLYLTADSLSIDVELEALYFYNKKGTKYVRLLPSDIKAGSSKANLIENNLADIKAKSKELFESTLKSVIMSQPSQAYQR